MSDPGQPTPGVSPLPPPVAPRRPKELEAHGDRRVDDWWWLRQRDDPEVIEHLRLENAYTEAQLAHLDPLRQTLFGEMVARVQETDVSAPVRHGPWWYYDRTREGLEYPIHVRLAAAAGDDEPPPVSELAESPPGEQVVLDQNALASGGSGGSESRDGGGGGGGGYLQLGALSTSPDHRWLAYSTDRSGEERFDLVFRGLPDPSGPAGDRPGPDAPETIANTSYGGAWAGDSATYLYTTLDEAMRPHQVWRHQVGTDPAGDQLVYEEPDRRFHLSVHRTRDEQFIVISSTSSVTSELRVLRAVDPFAPPRVVLARRPGIEYSLDHHPAGGDGRPGWFFLLTNDQAVDFRVVALPDDDAGPRGAGDDRGAGLGGEPGGGAVDVVPHRPGVRVEDLDVLRGWLVLSERLEGEPRVRVASLDAFISSGAAQRVEALGSRGGVDLLADSRLVPTAETPSSTWVGANPEFDRAWLRVEQSSLVTPRTTSDIRLSDGSVVVRRVQPVRGDFDPDRYRTARLWASASDGTAVPISVVYRADLAETGTTSPTGGDAGPPGPVPCLLYGYGAYEHSIDPVFSSLRLSLLDRGFLFAIAHVRGGGELGRHWYEDGKLHAKPHTFSDFVACARHLVDTGWTRPDVLVGRGASAGGLLIGAVANLAPDLFRALVAEVPFVDALTTILDDSLPLSVIEWEEWGNPGADRQAYDIMRSYSPYDNVRQRDGDGKPVTYPDILATAGLEDPRVGYWEPAKWVAKLRAANAANRVLLRTEMGAGHGGPSGRYEAWKEEAYAVAFILDEVGPR